MSSSLEPRSAKTRSFDANRRLIQRAAAALVLGTLALGVAAQSPSPYAGIGRPATAKEVAAWDIDVRPDFKGLPKGGGSVAQGMEIWEAKCASCHGVFGESNEVFSPLIGGTTKDDIKTGRVKRLTDDSFPGRTTLMKVPTLSTLWDYINRAMPWNAPKSLKADEVYAVTAYMLNMAELLPENFTLSDRNMAEVQKLMPNRNGMTTDHGMWPGKGLGNGGKPDVKAVACMKDCTTEAKVASFLPDHARNAHGNLAEQNRLVGAQLGADTTRPAAPAGIASPRPAAPAETKAAAAQPASGGAEAAAALALFSKHNCSACHAVDKKVLGPSMQEVARRYTTRADRVEYLSGKILGGAAGAWGAIPMPAQNIPKADALAMARWVASGAGK
ncbi:MAG: c-type cytochrome [Betaproteobacteria bacterium]|jgi:cytochrome c